MRHTKMPKPALSVLPGSELSCQNWLIEAAYRMIQNNLDPDVAERPEDLVVYGGIGKAARNWPAFEAILRACASCGKTKRCWYSRGNRSVFFVPIPTPRAY